MRKAKWLGGLLAGVLLAGGLLWAWQMPANQAAAEETKASTITVNGSGEVSAAPDRAVISLAVTTLEQNAASAQQANATLAAKVVQALQDAGIAKNDIRTGSYSVYPEYNYGEQKAGEPLSISGYRVNNEVVVTLRDVSKVGSIIDKAVGAGANQVNNLRFSGSNDKELQRQALAEAVKDARARADAIAAALGKQVVDVMSVNEGGVSAPGPVYLMDKAAAGASTPILPGELSIAASVQAVFQIK